MGRVRDSAEACRCWCYVRPEPRVGGVAETAANENGVQAFFALMPAAQAATGEEQAPAQQAVLKADQPSYAEAFQRRAAGPRLPKVPYHRQAYHAFHYPDEAG